MSNSKRTFLDVSHVSTRSGNSYRLTLPKKVVKSLDLKKSDSILIFSIEDGKIILEKLRQP